MCRIVDERIDVPALESRVSGAGNGAVITFMGQARDSSEDGPIAYVEYDAYVPMAEKVLKQAAAEARERWGAEVAIEHRVGRVGPGETSFAICVGAAHSAQALEACSFCLAALKERAPIWRKEIRSTGAFWIEGKDCVKALV